MLAEKSDPRAHASWPGAVELHREIAPTADQVRQVLRDIGAWLIRRNLGGEVRANSEIVLAEALNNIVEHAYGNVAAGPGPGDAIRIRIRHHRGSLEVSICDRGRAMPGLMPPAGELPIIPAETQRLPEGGFGWFLIRELTSDLSYMRDGDWNCLNLTLPAA